MPPLATATPPSIATIRSHPASGALMHALHDEHTVLADLVATLERQRDAVAGDDIDTVNDTVFAAHRLLGAYREARSRRRSAVHLACGGGDGSVDELERSLGERLSVPEREAASSLREIARRLVDAIERNRTLLQAAMASGDAFFKVLTGASAPQPAVAYAPARPRSHAPAGAGPRLMDLRG